MRRSMIAGLVLAVFAALIIGLGELFGFDLQHVALLGAAIGGALGLIRHPYAWGRIAGFLVGFLAAWVGFALRAAVLPDSAAGRAVAAFLVILICALACGFSQGRLPLWSALLGAAAIVGAYEEIYTNAPSQFVSQSVEAGTTVLLAVAFGYLATAVVSDVFGDTSEAEAEQGRGATHARRERTGRSGDTTNDGLDQLDGLMAGDKK